MKIIILLLLFISAVTLFSHGDEVKDEHVEPKIKETNIELIDSNLLFSDKDEFEEIVIEMDNWSFSIDKINLQAGKNYRLTFITTKGHHGVMIPDLEYKSGNLKVGESISFDIKNISKGKFDFYCNIPCGSGHKKMKGLIQAK